MFVASFLTGGIGHYNVGYFWPLNDFSGHLMSDWPYACIKIRYVSYQCKVWQFWWLIFYIRCYMSDIVTDPGSNKENYNTAHRTKRRIQGNRTMYSKCREGFNWRIKQPTLEIPKTKRGTPSNTTTHSNTFWSWNCGTKYLTRFSACLFFREVIVHVPWNP